MNQLYVISYYIRDLLSLVVGGRKQGTFFRVLLRATHSSCLLLPSLLTTVCQMIKTCLPM